MKKKCIYLQTKTDYCKIVASNVNDKFCAKCMACREPEDKKEKEE